MHKKIPQTNWLLIATTFLLALLLVACSSPEESPAADTATEADNSSAETESTEAEAEPETVEEEAVMDDSAEMSAIRFGGQLYPGDYLLKGKPDLWGDAAVEHILFSSGTENNQALISGELDINVGSDSKTASLFAAIPDDAVILATMQRGDRYSTIVRDGEGFDSWEDLKGQVVGTRLGSGAEQVLRRYFEETDGLAWEDFEWVNLKVEDMAASLDSGAVAAFTAWEPTPAIAEAQGIGVVMKSYGDVALVPVSMHTTVAYAESHRAEIVEFLAAHIAKVELIESDPQQAAELAAAAASAQGSAVSSDAFLRIFERVDFSLQVDDDVLASIADTIQFLFEQGKLDSQPEVRWDGSFLEEAMAMAGSSMEADSSSDEAMAELSEIRFGGQFYPGDFVLKGDPALWGNAPVEHILFSSGTENNQALISGELDINVGSDSKTASLFAAIPDDALILATMQRGDRYSTIVRDGEGFDSWEDLKGQVVGTRLGSGAEQVLRRYFEETDGLAWEDFEWVNLKVEDMAASLDSGAVAAFTAWEPTPAIAEAQGIGVVMKSYGDVALVPVSMHTTIAYADSHRAEIVEFLAAHIAKVELIESDPQAAAELAAAAASAQGSAVTADAFLRIFERVDFSLQVDDDVLASIADTIQFLYDQGKLDSLPEVRWDGSFLEEAMEMAGVSMESDDDSGTMAEAVMAPDTLDQIRFGGQLYPGDYLLKGQPDLWGGDFVEHILFSSGTENNQALISGELDVNVGSDSKTASLFAAIPDDAVILATMQRGDRYSTIVRDGEGFDSWEDLKGQVVGTRLGSGAEQVLRRYFELTDGLAWEDFEWVNLKVEDMAASLDSGAVAAFTAWEPTPAIAEAQGIGVVMRSYGDIALVPVSMHTTLEYAESHREELVYFLAAHIAKVQLIESDPQQAAELAAAAASAQGSEVSSDAFLRIFERVDFSLQVDDEVLASIADTIQFLYDQGKLDSLPDVRWDGSFLEEAMALVGQ